MQHVCFRKSLRPLAALGLAAMLSGCSGGEPSTVLQFPPGTKPQEPIKVDPTQRATSGPVSPGDPSQYTKPVGGP